MTATKNIIADSFSRSASQYDSAANIQQQAGRQLLSCVQQYINKETDSVISGSVIADVGCGTGFFAQPLVALFQPKQYLGIDIAEGMLAVAKENNADYFLASSTAAQWCCHDAENLLLANESVDIIFANFSLQWCDDLPSLMRSFYRVMKPGGLVCFTSLGENTLHELRNAWQHVDNITHVNQFMASSRWQQATKQVGFVVKQHYSNDMIEYFDSPTSVMRSLKTIGANIIKGQQQSGLTGKQRFAQLLDAYEKCRATQGVPATYAVDGWIIKKPEC
ncbi:malonyl-ACP O-methyltransferase BioC [Eionea flava]